MHNEAIDINLYSRLAYVVELCYIGNDSELKVFNVLRVPCDTISQGLELVSQLLSTTRLLGRLQHGRLIKKLLKFA